MNWGIQAEQKSHFGSYTLWNIDFCRSHIGVFVCHGSRYCDACLRKRVEFSQELQGFFFLDYS